MKINAKVAATKDEWVQMAAETILSRAKQAISERGICSLVLSGGSTPAPVYTALARLGTEQNLDWEKMAVFWGDERCVPPTHPDSNYRMARETLLDHLPILPENVFRMMGELDPETAATDYEGVLNAFFHQREKRFDILLLGLGSDGHTASLFPGIDGLHETQRWVIPNRYPYSDTWRISLTYPAINQSRYIFFLVSGDAKAEVVANCMEHPQEPPPYPAKGVTGVDHPPVWLLDADAAKMIPISD